jgi:translation initiation factor IF-1
MVKNTTGGTRTKGLARKHQGAGGGGRLRIPEDELEKVAYVSKMLGNGMCQVYINDNKDPLIAHIRKKFSGRHKRSNLIATGTCLLIGLRDWENPCKNCDVINVYDHHDLTTILNLPAINTNIIAPMFNPDAKLSRPHQPEQEQEQEQDDFVFDYQTGDNDYENTIETIPKPNILKLPNLNQNQNEFDFNDI